MCRYKSRIKIVCINLPQHQQLAYGNHMCHSMATGLLFLGGGKYSLSTTPDAIGPLLCSLYTHFPLTSTDNRYHLQAFRHLYVLACEPRLLIPRDVDSRDFCYVPLRIKYKGCAAYKAVTFDTGSPHVLPELSKIEEVQVVGSRYWPVMFREDKNWDTLRRLLQRGGVLGVKQRAGHLPYMQDPKGYRGMLVKSLMAEAETQGVASVSSSSSSSSSSVTGTGSSSSSRSAEVIKSFTSDAKVTALAELFLSPQACQSSLLQEICAAVHQCVTHETTEVINTHLILSQLTQHHCSGEGGSSSSNTSSGTTSPTSPTSPTSSPTSPQGLDTNYN